MNQLLTVKDANGNWMVIKEETFTEVLCRGGCKLFGMTLENIIDLKAEYDTRNGKYPMTSETIKEAFR